MQTLGLVPYVLYLDFLIKFNHVIVLINVAQKKMFFFFFLRYLNSIISLIDYMTWLNSIGILKIQPLKNCTCVLSKFLTKFMYVVESFSI